MSAQSSFVAAHRPGSAVRSLQWLAAVAALLCSAVIWAAPRDDPQPYTTWRTYLGSPDSSHYSALTQINRANVNELEVAWSYDTGNDRRYELNPLVVGNTVYVIAQNLAVVALDATTGKQLWIHHTESIGQLLEVHRGINFWQSKDGSEQRLLIPFGNRLEAVDARTGALIKSFGSGGYVDLREGLGRDPQPIIYIQSGTPGQVFGDLLILGSSTIEDYGSPPGDVRAYDVRSGKMTWIFHTIPHPGEHGYRTWPKGAWKYSGGANCWGEMSLDEKRGIVYVPTASAKYDFYGADRIGDDLFADSLLALDARTGKLLWHYQLIHHDLWDYDANAAPQLLTVEHDGAQVPIVAQASKQGFLYVLNRLTGRPLWPIEERPVPKSAMPGEVASPTQPFPSNPPPFARQTFTLADLDPYLLTTQARAKWTRTVEGAVNTGLFTPPGLTDTIQMPGNSGGANWGSTASNPMNGTLFVVAVNMPAILKNEALKQPDVWDIPTDVAPAEQGKAIYHLYCQRCHGDERQGAPPAIPSLVNAPKVYGEDTIRSVVEYGLQTMPGFPELNRLLVTNLMLYLGNPDAAPGPLAALQPAARPPPNSHEGGRQPPARYWSNYNLQPTIIGPPWSTLTAYDLNQGTIKWQVPYGDIPALTAQGITGTGIIRPRGGPVVTAGGLIFAATLYGKLYAYDQETGKEVWSASLPAGSEGVPAVYEADGREYIVVCATSEKTNEVIPSSGFPNPNAEPVHRSYIAFALPKQLVERH